MGNRTGIHIEIAKDNDTDSEEEWKKARDNGARLAADLLYKYGWGIDHLKKHQDFKMTDGNYKYCPHKILDEGWDDFKLLVSQYLNKLNETPKEDKKPETTKPDDKEEEDKIAQTSTLIALLIKLLQKILSFLKQPKGKNKSTERGLNLAHGASFFYAFL